MRAALRQIVLSQKGALSAFSPIKAKIAAGAADVVVTAVGDSTSSATDEFLYLWFAQVALQYPSHTFEYYPADGVGGYGTLVTVSTGTGSRKVTLYNNSVAGEQIMFPMGSLFSTVFAVTPDLVIWNMGKNHVNLYPNALDWPLITGEFVAAMTQVQVAFPLAQHVAIKQDPNRDDANMAAMDYVWSVIKTFYPELQLIDFYSQTYAFGDYTDNNHLTPAANSAKLLPIMMAAWNGARSGAFAPATPWFNTKVTNQLDGDAVDYGTRSQVYGDFNNSAAAPAAPSNWTSSGTIVFTDEATIKYGSASKSLKMEGSGAAATRVNRVPTTARRTAMAGQWIVLTVLHYLPAGGDNTMGRIGISYTAPSVNGGATKILSSRGTTKARDGWRFSCIGPLLMPADLSAINVNCWHDTDATPDTDPIYFQKAVLAIGQVPRDTL